VKGSKKISKNHVTLLAY